MSGLQAQDLTRTLSAQNLIISCHTIYIHTHSNSIF